MRSMTTGLKLQFPGEWAFEGVCEDNTMEE